MICHKLIENGNTENTTGESENKEEEVEAKN